LTRKLHQVKHPRSLPTVLSREQVMRMLAATTSIKHQATLSVAYGAGLRASEVSRLKVRDIDSERMLLRVQCGKGGRHRNAIGSGQTLPASERPTIVRRQAVSWPVSLRDVISGETRSTC
jgi:site-specific recombinase XerD